ncbi:hypothetical protein MKW92_009204 [Papaver armeniacum]|nr:hypothetical protein MKW92_009204 [Papaver armeniacum]
MSLLSNGKYNQGSGKIPTSKAVQDGDDSRRPRKIHRTSCSITNLPDDCLNLIFKCLETKGDYTKTRDDRNSFGLTCRQWLNIQNNNHESLWYLYSYGSYPEISDETFPMVVCKLLTRFQNIKNLGLSGRPKITDFVTSKPPFFGSKVQYLCLDYCYHYSDIELSISFSWFPRLKYVTLTRSRITDKGLEALAECCSSLNKVKLPWCHSITDSGISFLLQNCGELGSLCISYCSKITGIGFLECPKTLTKLEAIGCKLKPEGIKAIVNGGGMNRLILSARLSMDEEGCIDTEAVIAISKGCPLLKKLILARCHKIELEGWEAIGRNCKNLEILDVRGCKKLCDQGLQALFKGCNKLSRLLVDNYTGCSSSALNLFRREKPQCQIIPS